MIIPDKVKIGGQTYRIERPDIVSEENRDVDGLIFYDKDLIRIKGSLCGDYESFVFIHELIHAIYDFLNFEQEEDEVNRFAKAFHMVIKDNPDIFRYIKGVD